MADLIDILNYFYEGHCLAWQCRIYHCIFTIAFQTEFCTCGQLAFGKLVTNTFTFRLPIKVSMTLTSSSSCIWNGGIVWWLDLQLHPQSVPITTNVVSSNPAHGEVYSIQHYVIKFVNDFNVAHN
jgi:hypothetical protein